ncbi:MAG: D-alanine--D-alanine ligase family protein [Christensenellales bacterium]
MKNIVVLFGGKSSEHDISLLTANLVLNAINEEKYRIYPIFVDKKNKWFYVKNFKNNITKDNKKEEVFLTFGSPILYKKHKITYNKFIKVDCAILCHHGLNGEDGTIQGMLELCDIPYTSSGVAPSSITMDKIFMKHLFKALNFKTVDYDYFTIDDYKYEKERLILKLENSLKYPLIIKPSRLGSSIGISTAKNREELIKAIELALTFDDKILVEKMVEDFKEINCACIKSLTHLIASSLEEPIKKEEILNFNDKYISGGKNSIKRKYPAKLNDKLTKEIKKMSKEIYEKFDLSGCVRIDYIVKDGEVYVNEINSIPGSLAYYLFERENLSFSEIIDLLILKAIEKFNQKKNLTYTFESSVLNSKKLNKLKK